MFVFYGTLISEDHTNGLTDAAGSGFPYIRTYMTCGQVLLTRPLRRELATW